MDVALPNTRRFGGNELAYVTEVLESEFRASTAGGMNQRLERAFAARHGLRYAITHNSGTSTLHTCLAAAGVGPGDEVISPGLTVMMNAFATMHQNAVPVFADVDAETFTMDVADLQRKITPRTKAIMVVSLYGLPADMDPIMEIAAQHRLVVIEDNAQCFLGVYKGRLAGTIGHMASYSFEDSKHISTGDGGIVITDDERLAERVRKFSALGFKNLTASEGRVRLQRDVFQDPDYKRHTAFGWNYRLSELQAAVALAQVERIDELVGRRQAVARLYDEATDGCHWLIPQRVPEGYVNAYYTYAMKFDGQAAHGGTWRQFRRQYLELGGDGFYAAWSVPYLEPVMTQREFYGRGCPFSPPWYDGQVKFEPGLCPTAEAIQPKLMQFKTNYLDLEEAKGNAEALRRTIQAFGG